MSLRLSFELSDRDLRFFRNALRRSRDVVTSADESEIIDAIRGVIDDIRKSEPLPDFVATRLPELESMLQMLADDEWGLPAAERGWHSITREVLQTIPELGRLQTGLLHVFIKHTSASLSINENADPDVLTDLEMALNRIAPEQLPYTHTLEGPDDMPAHVKSSL